MTLKHINIFLEVSKTLNVTQASKNLYMTQPAVSLAIKELEEELNVNLFIRNKGRLTLSPAGKRLYIKAREIQASLDEFYIEATNSTNQEPIHIASSLSFGTYYLPSFITYFKDKYDVLFDIKIEPSNLVIDDIENGNADIGFIEDDLVNSRNEEIPLIKDSLVIVGSRELLAKYEKSNFEAMPLMVRNKLSGTRLILDHELEKITNKPDIIVTSTTNEALIEYAKKGLGFAVLPYCTVKSYLDSGALLEYKQNLFALSRSIRVIYLKNKKLNDNLDALLNEIKTYNFN